MQRGIHQAWGARARRTRTQEATVCPERAGQKKCGCALASAGLGAKSVDRAVPYEPDARTHAQLWCRQQCKCQGLQVPGPASAKACKCQGLQVPGAASREGAAVFLLAPHPVALRVRQASVRRFAARARAAGPGAAVPAAAAASLAAAVVVVLSDGGRVCAGAFRQVQRHGLEHDRLAARLCARPRQPEQVRQQQPNRDCDAKHHKPHVGHRRWGQVKREVGAVIRVHNLVPLWALCAGEETSVGGRGRALAIVGGGPSTRGHVHGTWGVKGVSEGAGTGAFVLRSGDGLFTKALSRAASIHALG
eukprot:354026-Chlamydomonas_euryale.AAC.2